MLHPKFKRNPHWSLTVLKVTLGSWLMIWPLLAQMNHIACSLAELNFGCFFDQTMQTFDSRKKVSFCFLLNFNLTTHNSFKHVLLEVMEIFFCLYWWIFFYNRQISFHKYDCVCGWIVQYKFWPIYQHTTTTFVKGYW